MRKILLVILIISACFISYVVGYNTTTQTTNLSLIKILTADDELDWFDNMNDNLDLIDAGFDNPLAYSITGVAGDIIYYDGTDWVKLAKDVGKYLKSGASAVSWNDPAGAGDMNKSTYDTNEDSDIDVAAGGTEKSAWTLYAIPYLSGTTAFGEIPIGTAEYALTVNAGATGYDWTEFPTDTNLTQEEVDDYVNALIKDTDSVHTRITITYDDTDNAFDFVVDDMNDDVPESGDFGAAGDLDADGTITNEHIVEAYIKAVDAPADEDIFTYESTTGDFEWHTKAELGIGTATAITDSLIIEADLNADEEPADNDILTFDTTGANFSWQTLAELNIQPLEATLTDIADGTINENLVNTANPWADNEVANDITIDLATLATTITVTDNESTNENNPICFVAGADPDGGSLGIETDGDLHYNSSTGTVTATAFAGALTGNVTGNADTVTTNANLTGIVTSTGNATAIADKAIAIAKLADGTDGELITWDASGVIATVPVGTATHVLTSGGVGVAPTFQAVSATDITVADTTDTTCWVGLWESVTGSQAPKSDAAITYNAGTGMLTVTGITSALTGNAATCTTASAGDAAIDFFGAGVDAVTDATTCTDLEGTYLSITAGTLNVSGLQTTLTNEAGLYGALSDVSLFLEDTIDDTTPELGGEMDAGAHSIGFTQQTVTYNETTTTVVWTNSNKATVTLTGNVGTMAFTNPSNPCNVLLKIVQDATGSRVVTAWDADIMWVGGTKPTLTTTGNGIDICSFYWDGTNYFGVASLAFATP